MGEVIHVLLLVVFKTFPFLLIIALIILIIFIISKSRKQIQATSKVAIRRGKEYCENSSVINKIQNEVKDFSEEVKAELKPQAQNKSVPTSKEILTKKAEKLPTILIGIAAEVIQYFESALLKENLTVDDRDAIGKEIFALTLHLTDRILYSSLGAKDRSLLMDNLIVETEILLYKSKVPSIADYYNERSIFYSKFGKLVEGQNEKPDGTLFFEFGRSFVELHGEARDESSALAQIMTKQVATLAINLFEIINDALIKENIVRV